MSERTRARWRAASWVVALTGLVLVSASACAAVTLLTGVS